ncbi:MARVEL domain-containing protein 1-like isoform X2 [Eriocheir sinensis]|nr:MARVEL domain-containing protein 1-like isoform X2 [Eriocheir sinensis]XP_050702646.1 MARVEL domain-containing protein 1-like isoform X2 [Eriocheir sinensis]
MEGGMVDPGFPVQTTTTTTTTTAATTTIYFDKAYINPRNIPAILKIAVMVTNLIGYLCSAFSTFNYYSHSEWFCFVSMTGFWATGILLILYVLHVVEKFQRVPWLKVELGYCTLWALLYLIAASVCIWRGGADTAAGFFGYVSLVIYAVDAFFKFKAWRSGEVAQGERQMEAQPELASPGAY